MSAIEKACRVLATVCESPRPPRFSDLVTRVGLPKSTVHRMLGELMDQQLVRYDAEQQVYTAGYRLLDFARRTWEESDVRQVAQPAMRELMDAAQETVHLAVLDGHEIIYIDKLESRRGVRLYSAVGKRGPIYCTGVGKALLAFLPAAEQDAIIADTDFVAHTPQTLADAASLRQALGEIRVRGCALDMEEHEEGIRCVAAPVFNFRGDAVASISVTSTARRMPVERLQDLQPLVLEASRRISRELGHGDSQSSAGQAGNG